MRRPAPVKALVLEGFTSRLAFGVLTFALPLYARELGMSIAAIGVLSSLAGIVSLSLKPVTGRLIDRWGVRRSVLLGLCLRSLLCLGYVLASAPAHLMAVRGLHGASDAVRDPAVHALIAANGGKRSMASTFAWYQTAKTTAGSLGKSIAGVLLATAVGFHLAFAVAFVLSLLPLLVLAFAVPADQPAPRRPAPARTRHRVRRVARPGAGDPRAHRRGPRGGHRAAGDPKPPGLLAYSALGFLVAGTASMLQALFPVIATEYAGLSTAQAGLLYLVTPVLAFTGPVWGWLADRVSRTLVLSVRSVANTGSSLLYLFLPSLAGVWLGKCLDDVGKAAFRPAWGSLMADVANRRPSERARVMGYLTAGEDAGTIAAPIAAGLLWTAWGVPALLLGRIALSLVSEVYTVRLERRAARTQAAPNPPVEPSAPATGPPSSRPALAGAS